MRTLFDRESKDRVGQIRGHAATPPRIEDSIREDNVGGTSGGGLRLEGAAGVAPAITKARGCSDPVGPGLDAILLAAVLHNLFLAVWTVLRDHSGRASA